MIRRVRKSRGIALFEILVSLPLGLYFILALAEISNFIKERNQLSKATHSAALYIKTASPNKKGSIPIDPINEELTKILSTSKADSKCATVVPSKEPQTSCSVISASRGANSIDNNSSYSVKIELQKKYTPILKGLGLSLPDQITSTLTVKVPPDRSLPPTDCPNGKVLIFNSTSREFECGLEFAGMFQRYLCDTSDNYIPTGSDCIQKNPVTGNCKCPEGFNEKPVFGHYEPELSCSYPNNNCKKSCFQGGSNGNLVNSACPTDNSINNYLVMTCPQAVYNRRGMVMFLCDRAS